MERQYDIVDVISESMQHSAWNFKRYADKTLWTSCKHKKYWVFKLNDIWLYYCHKCKSVDMLTEEMTMYYMKYDTEHGDITSGPKWMEPWDLTSNTITITGEGRYLMEGE